MLTTCDVANSFITRIVWLFADFVILIFEGVPVAFVKVVDGFDTSDTVADL